MATRKQLNLLDAFEALAAQRVRSGSVWLRRRPVKREIRWVGQREAHGCGPAVLAMLSGESYEAIKVEIATYEGTGHKGDWEAAGVTHYTLDEFLIRRGVYEQRVYQNMHLSEVWPPNPWADAHFAAVQQPSGNSHFVVMDKHGCVHDPLREGHWSLWDWPRTLNVVGLVWTTRNLDA